MYLKPPMNRISPYSSFGDAVLSMWAKRLHRGRLSRGWGGGREIVDGYVYQASDFVCKINLDRFRS